ncbi:thermonuclease family protein [Ancylobacter sp. G4_0304]|uniref:thermonuclease family protein n=1 Tax=Ancylobacter sp. G4_0304 TaxID=3114289 RepID=UPI0039C68A5A
MSAPRRRSRRGWRPDTWKSVLVALILIVVALAVERFLPAITGSVRVADGDSLEVGGERIRLEGLDAPELHQSCGAPGREWPCGRRAREALQKLVDAGEVSCRPVDEDRYGRAVAICEAGGRDLGRAMVAQGLAISLGAYGAEEREARASQRGIWAGPFERPADWRARNM